METSSTHIELNLPTTPPAPSNISSPGLTGAIAPIPMGSDIKPFPSFDFMFSNNNSGTSSSS
ncbi:MAG: hypothetical protein K2W97_05910 [Chthoniobacterales bacterium]|nr:hypothetical protein [Chthoniobacterales bacterium]